MSTDLSTCLSLLSRARLRSCSAEELTQDVLFSVYTQCGWLASRWLPVVLALAFSAAL